MKNKKASMSIEMIIVIILALLVLIFGAYAIGSKFGLFNNATGSCVTAGGKCMTSSEASSSSLYSTEVAKCLDKNGVSRECECPGSSNRCYKMVGLE